jgi:hypothetical protein
MTASQDLNAQDIMSDPRAEAIQALLDEREIRQVIVRYVHACDRLDEDELRTIYHPGAFDDHGPIRGSESTFIPTLLEVLRSKYALVSHTLGQTNFVSYSRDDARTETYVFAVTGRQVDGREVLDINGGRYIDHFERRDGVWRIADRIFVPDWDTRIERDRWQVPGQWTLGSRDRRDPSYFAHYPTPSSPDT